MKVFTLVLTLLVCSYSFAQEKEDEKVKAVVLSLFEGMRTADSVMVRATFMDDAQMYTIATGKNGEPVIRRGSLQRFVTAVGTPHDKVWNEPIWDTEVRIDGHLAQVWTQYAFYLGNEFSHCGVDAFQLFKTSDGWKIFQIADTRKKEGCEVPEEVKEAYK